MTAPPRQGLIRVVVADDHPSVRIGIRRLLESAPDIVIVGEASDGIQALSLVEGLLPDILLLDVEMPGMDGLQVAAKLRERQTPVQVLALSAYNDQQYTQGMLENGAVGYLTKDDAPAILLEVMRRVMDRKPNG